MVFTWFMWPWSHLYVIENRFANYQQASFNSKKWNISAVDPGCSLLHLNDCFLMSTFVQALLISRPVFHVTCVNGNQAEWSGMLKWPAPDRRRKLHVSTWHMSQIICPLPISQFHCDSLMAQFRMTFLRANSRHNKHTVHYMHQLSSQAVWEYNLRPQWHWICLQVPTIKPLDLK